MSPSTKDAITQITTSATYARQLVASPPPTTPSTQQTLTTLNLQPHPEGGYFSETDRDPLLVPNPFINLPALPNASSSTTVAKDPTKRNAMTTIHYYLTPQSPIGHFHRNRARTVHTLHYGRGRYALIHADEEPARVETFVVGTDIEAGERVQWIVDGGKFKTSFLLPDGNAEGSGKGLLISETVVPGFEFADHDFLTAEGLGECLGEEGVQGLWWLLGRGEREKLGREARS